MKIRSIYKSIIKRKHQWNYYNKDIEDPILSDYVSCKNFIKNYIKYSEKSRTVLFEDIDYIEQQLPKRIIHIVSTFLLGIWFYRNTKSTINKKIRNELWKLPCFKQNKQEIDKQFSYVWFMAALFHDLGYKAEMAGQGDDLPQDGIVGLTKLSAPDFCKDVFKDYYNYRNKKEHGIYAGLLFDKDICEIRRYQEHGDSGLNWNENLEELYHYVAWIVLSHNIWMIRDNDNDETKKYKEKGLEKLILSSEKNDKGQYNEYKIKFYEYPLFTLFCIIDTIEPIKNTTCFSDIDIRLIKDKILITSNDSIYRKKVFSLNSWLMPVTIDNNTLTISLRY